MYKIYYSYNNTETLFCDDASTLDSYKLTDAVLQLASNSAGSLDFEMSSINVAYNMLNRMRGTVKVTKNDKLTWEGRILQEDSDFWGNKSIYCEGILACLNDTRQPQMIYKDMPLRSYMESLLSIHNQKVDDTRRFEIGIVTVNDGAFISPRKTNYESTWECFASLVDEYGGYLFIRYDGDKRYLDYRKECPRTSSQKIEFGVNLMDFTKSYDMSSLCTVLLPLGQTLASAGSKTIGDVINANVSGGWYIDPDDGYNAKYDSSLDGHYFGSSSYIAVEAGKTYYISCRNHGGRAMWALKDAGGNLIDTYSASTGEGMTDLVEYRLEIPKSDVGNVYYLAIAGFGYDIQPRVNAAIEADEAFDEYTTVANVNNGSLYVTNQEAVTAYGWIEKQLTWANVTDPAELKRVAETYLREGQFDEMSLEIKAVDLQMMGIDADRIDILDEVLVVSEPHGLNKTFPVTELTIKIGLSSENKFTLGYKTEQTLSGVVSSANDEIFAKLNQIPSRSAILESARNNATMLINNTLSGIFMLEQNEDGTNIGFRISNVEDWDADGAKGWRFTMGGLGFFGDGFDKPVTLALTGEDGGIVANCITSGTMYGDRIHGGTLTLGGYNNDNGILLVRNVNGDDICRFDNNGGYINGELYTVNSQGYWMRLADGQLTGGTRDTQTVTIDSTAVITDADNYIDYRGVLIRADAIDLRCNFLGVDGATGESGAMTFLSDITFEEDEIEVVTDAQIVDGELQLTKETIKYISGWMWTKTSVYFHKGIMWTSLDEKGDAPPYSGGGSTGGSPVSGGGTLKLNEQELTTETFPLSLEAAGAGVDEYILWGNDGGVGVHNPNGENYLIPITVSNGTDSKTVNLNIGKSLLYSGEYVVYSEQMLYRESIIFPFTLDDNEYVVSRATITIKDGTVSVTGQFTGYNGVCFVVSLYQSIAYQAGSNVIGNIPIKEQYAFKLKHGLSYTLQAIADEEKGFVSMLVGKLNSSVWNGYNPAKEIRHGQSFDVTDDETYCMPILALKGSVQLDGFNCTPKFSDIESSPVSLPQLPTFAGTNTFTVGTDVQPAKIYIKYKKKES